MKLSIIIPIYNVEIYLRECLDSIKGQSFGDFEVIMVNDGSTDSSPSIAEEYVRMDSRFKLFHKENGGLMSAWKYGVEKAVGEYIGFVDSDDYVQRDMFETLCCAIEKDNSDIVCCGFRSLYENYSVNEDLYVDEGKYSKADLIQKIYPVLFNTGKGIDFERAIYSARWNKIFKKQLVIDNIKYFDESISYGEDMLAVSIMVMAAQSITVLRNKFLYNYRVRRGSISRRYIPDLSEQINKLEKLLYEAIMRNERRECLPGYYRDMYSLQFKKMSNIKIAPMSKHNKLTEIAKLLNSEYVVKCLPYVKECISCIKGRVKYFLVKHKLKRLLLYCL